MPTLQRVHCVLSKLQGALCWPTLCPRHPAQWLDWALACGDASPLYIIFFMLSSLSMCLGVHCLCVATIFYKWIECNLVNNHWKITHLNLQFFEKEHFYISSLATCVPLSVNHLFILPIFLFHYLHCSMVVGTLQYSGYCRLLAKYFLPICYLSDPNVSEQPFLCTFLYM